MGTLLNHLADVLCKNKKNIKTVLPKIVNFHNLKSLCLLPGQVFVIISTDVEQYYLFALLFSISIITFGLGLSVHYQTL